MPVIVEERDPAVTGLDQFRDDLVRPSSARTRPKPVS
jgi:hypothetical protein